MASGQHGDFNGDASTRPIGFCLVAAVVEMPVAHVGALAGFL